MPLVLFAAAHDIADHSVISDAQRLGKFLQVLGGAGIGERLEHRPYLPMLQLLGCPQGGCDLRWVVGVVICHGDTGMGAEKFKAAAGAVESGNAGGDLFRGHAAQGGGGGHGQRIADIVLTRHAQPDLGQKSTVVPQIVDPVGAVLRADVFGPPGVALAKPEGDALLAGDAFHCPAGVFVIAVIDHGVGGLLCKPVEGADDAGQGHRNSPDGQHPHLG